MKPSDNPPSQTYTGRAERLRQLQQLFAKWTEEDGRLTDDEIRDELREAANALVLAAGPQLVAA